MNSNNRLIIGGAVLAALVGVAVWATVSRGNESTSLDDAGGMDKLWPKIALENVRQIQVHVPEEKPVTLTKTGDTWKVTAPVQATADQSAAKTASEKIAELEITRVAATNKKNHERLEVSQGKGVRVVAKGGGKTLVDFFVGAYSGGGTLVRRDGEDKVLSAAGSLKWVFNKKLKDWRDRQILEITADEIKKVEFTGDAKNYSFSRSDDDTWSPEKPIKDFDPDKIRSIVTGLANLRANDFAAQGVPLTELGLQEPLAKVVLSVEPKAAEPPSEDKKNGDSPEPQATENKPAEPFQVTILAGKREGTDLYVKRPNSDVVFKVAEHAAKKIVVSEQSFKKDEDDGEDEPRAQPMIVGSGEKNGLKNVLSPETLRQLQQRAVAKQR